MWVPFKLKCKELFSHNKSQRTLVYLYFDFKNMYTYSYKF